MDALDLKYRYVIGSYALTVADSPNDDDKFPDAKAPVGTVTFRPVAASHIVESPRPVTVVPQKIVCVIDKTGLIRLTGENEDLGVWLIVGQYAVSFSFQGGVTLTGFTINVTDEHTVMYQNASQRV